MNKPSRSIESSQREAVSPPIQEDYTAIWLQIGELAVKSGNRWRALQEAGAERMLAEVTMRQNRLLKDLEQTSDFAEWPSFGVTQVMARAQRNLQLCRAWWEMTTRTQDAMLEAMQQSFGKPAMPSTRPVEALTSVERRRRSVVINFPDRRIAA